MKITQFHAENEILSGLPRGTPMPSTTGLPRMDPEVVTAPFRALAQLGQAVSDLGARLTEVELKKKEADWQTEALKLYSEFAQETDRLYGEHKLTTDPETGHRTFFDDVGKTIRTTLQKYAAKASNRRVHDLFMQRAAPFVLERAVEARRHQDKLTVDYHKSGLRSYLAVLRNHIATAEDENTARLFLRHGLTQIDTYAGVIGAEAAVKEREDFKTAMGNLLARQSMHRDPLAFLPASAGGRDGYLRYQDLANPEFMEKLLERAPKLLEHEENRRHMLAVRRREEMERVLREEASSWSNQIRERLLNPTLAVEERPTLHEINLGLAKYHSVIPPSEQDAMRKLATDPLLQGGVDRPGAREEVENAILMGEVSTDEAHIMKRRDLSLKTKNELITQLRQRRKLDDISNDHFYKAGEKTIYLVLGGVTPEQAALGFFGMGMLAKPEARQNLARALRMFDMRARGAGVKREDLPKIADEIVQVFLKTDREQEKGTSPSAPEPATAPQEPAGDKPAPKKEGPGLLNTRRKK